MSWLSGFCQWLRGWCTSPELACEGPLHPVGGFEAAGIVDAAMTALSRPSGPTPSIVVMNDEAGDWARLYWLLAFAGRRADAADVAQWRAVHGTFTGLNGPGNAGK